MRATDKAGVVAIAVENGADKLAFQCKRMRIPAARADAGRALHAPQQGYGCGEDGRWQPGATKPLDAIRCTSEPDNADELLAFSPEPGIEWVFVGHDCLVGGGWRAVPTDSSVAHPLVEP